MKGGQQFAVGQRNALSSHLSSVQSRMATGKSNIYYFNYRLSL